MIEVNQVTRRFSDKIAVNDISFSVSKGEVLGFLGPNGAGKTTTMRMITGSLATTSGSIRVGGFDILENPIEAKRMLGYLPESPPLYFDMTVSEFLKFTARIKGLSGKVISHRIDYVTDACDLGSVHKRLIKNLSKGFRQRTGIAAALIHSPEMLILDEPTIGLDPKQIIEARKLIKSLASEHTILLSTHILPEVTMTCSRVIIINEGKIIAQDSYEKLTSNFQETTRIKIKIKTPPREKKYFLSEIRSIDGVRAIVPETEFAYIIETDREIDIRDAIASKIVHDGMGLLELSQENISLEDVFMKLTTKESTL